ncbi:MAG: nickel pincer cofactor biosynthesis protein LarB [Phycisphaerales bacterium]|nr:nickel pincer cofactor biosynthesis protein LarB [Phycisphaerales bacterium]
MDEQALRELLSGVRERRVSLDEAIRACRNLPFEDLGFAKVDHHRSLRCGFPEVIYCAGKTTAQVVEIFERRRVGGGNVLATRATAEVGRAVRRKVRKARYNPIAQTVVLRQNPARRIDHYVAIVCAGTSDMPVAEEARETCEIMDQPTRSFYDVGVAGIHRLLAHAAELNQARAVVVCAGMEGALASVVGGLVPCPVIAVPTSIGYGASFGGLAPLLTMLNSCAAGVAVVNIDNGFGAGYMAALIGRSAETPTEPARCSKPPTRRQPR